MKRKNFQIETRIAILYAIFGGLWILFSDSLLNALVPNLVLYARIQTYKGWLFVAASALLIYSLVRQEAVKRNVALEKLRASEEALQRFKLLSEHSRDIILFMRREDGRILDINAAAMQAYGYSREELLALTVQNLRAPDTQGLTTAQMAQADSVGFLFETTHMRKDGSTFPVEVNSQGATISGVRTLVSIVRDITQRKQAEAEASANKAKLEAALASVSDAVFISDNDGRFIEFNDAFATFHKFRSKEECATTLAEYPDFLEVFMEDGELAPLEQWAVPRALRGETGTNVEYSLRRKDTDESWVGSYSFAPIRDQAGSIVGSVVVGRDITASKRAEQEIESLSRFPTENHNPVMRILNDGQIIYANAASQKLLDLWDCSINAYLPAALKDLIREISESGLAKTVEVPCNGTVYSLMLVPVLKSGYVNLYGQDITARLRAEQALFDSEEKYRLVADNANDWIYWIKPDGNFRYVSPSCARLTGFTHLDFLTNPRLYMEIIHPDDRERVETHIETNQLETERETFEFRIITKAGEIRWISHSCAPLFSAEDEFLGRRGTNNDITERKQVEEQLHYQAALLLNVNDAIVASDAQFCLTAWNSGAEVLYGWKAEEVLGRNGVEVIRTEWPGEAADEMRRTIAETGQWRGEATQARKDGSRFPVEVSSMVLYDGRGRVTGYVSVNREITERKQAEAALRDSEQRLNRAQEIAHLGSWELDLVTSQLTWSDEVYRIFGLHPQEFGATYEAFLDIVHPDDRAAVDHAYSGSIREGKDTYEIEHRIVRRGNGEVRIVLERCEHFRNEQGQIVRSVGMVHDITERKQAEEALRESEAFTKTVLDNLPIGIAVNSVDPMVTFNYMNDNFPKFYRTTSEKLAGPDAFWHVVYEDPDFREEIKKRVLDDIGSGDLERMHWVDIPITRKGKETTFITARNIPITGKSIMISTVWDNTGRKRAEEALRQAAENLDMRTRELNAILSSVQEFVYMFDPNGRFVFANKKLLDLWGMTSEQAIGKSMRDLDYPETVAATLLEGVRQVQESGKSVTNITQYTSPSGVTGSYENILAPMLGPDGKVSFVAGSSRDITERQRAEDELFRTMEELKHSNAELEQFAYVASHDLQEPLRGIAGLAELLQQRYQGQLDSRADEYITYIVDGTQRMQTLINDLLAYSRIGRRGEAIQPTPAEAALLATLQNLKAAIQEYGATVTNESLPTVRADATQLIQLFQNLIGNAIKFRSERPPHIHVAVAEVGDCWQFSVHDNGIGIEPQYFERIFQVFQRLHTLREYKGTGIGLAICKKIIDRHGGQIWVESEPGQGSTFYFTLPKGD